MSKIWTHTHTHTHTHREREREKRRQFHKVILFIFVKECNQNICCSQ